MEEENNSICYKNNFLKEVIVKIDLVSPISSIINELDNEIIKKSLESFPIDEPKKGFTQEVSFSPDELKTQRKEFTEWNFFGRSREKLLRISPSSFFISVYDYLNFVDLRNDFLKIHDIFFKVHKDTQPSRLGLRYINQFDLEKEISNPFEWKKYINSDLLGLFNFSVEDSKTSRIFHNLEFVFDEQFNLRFNFGLNNPDFPSPIKKKIFTLDYDAYYKGLLDIESIPDSLDKFHNSIQSLFEKNITDKMRGLLNE